MKAARSHVNLRAAVLAAPIAQQGGLTRTDYSEVLRLVTVRLRRGLGTLLIITVSREAIGANRPGLYMWYLLWQHIRRKMKSSLTILCEN